MLPHAHWPALDGLRALAVLSVMLFHAHAPALPGGFLGVDVFFVVSGFLITTQLHTEHAHTGRVRLGVFFLRRLARLQPALWAVLLFDLGLNLLGLNPWPVQAWWHESLVVLLGVANWARAWGLQPLELLGHSWSLGIEEQFYLAWVLLWLGLQKTRTPLAVQWALVLALALASAVFMAWLLGQGASVNRLYNGTDTRMQALLMGCALALWRAKVFSATRASGSRSRGLQLGGWLALLGLAVMAWRIQWQAPAMYQGGFALLAVLSAVVVAALVWAAPEGALGRVLSWSPLARLGVVSYGLYLWHYPFYRMALHLAEQYAPGQPTWAMGALVLATALTWCMAEISHRLLETPVRRWARQRVLTPTKPAGL